MKRHLLQSARFSLLLTLSLFIVSCSDDEDPETRITNYTFSVSSVNEGNDENTQTVTVTAVGTVGSEINVSYQVRARSASAGSDFLANTGILTFSPSSKSAEVPLTIYGDTNFELAETVDIVVPTETFDVVHTITILNDDNLPPVDEDAEGFLTPATYPSMNLVWADEFDGASLNTSDWNYELGDGCDRGICGWGNEELQNYTDEPANVHLENGRLLITAIESSGNYTSARITTQDKQEIQYGRIDIRARLPKGQGIWPAQWMLGANIDAVGWPVCGEIDIMELVGHEPDKVHGTVHYDNSGYATSSDSYKLSSGDFSDKFHVFTLVWEPNKMTWYVDGNVMGDFSRTSGGYPFNAPFFFIFNVAVGGRWPGNPDQTTVFPQTMEVDYIRVFQ